MNYIKNYSSDDEGSEHGTLIDSDEENDQKETTIEEEAEWDEETGVAEDDIRGAVAREWKKIKAETETNKYLFQNDSTYTVRRSECSIPVSKKAIAHFIEKKFQSWVQNTRVNLQGAEAVVKQCSQFVGYFLDKFSEHKVKPMTTVLPEICINNKEMFSIYFKYLDEVDKLKPSSVIERVKSCNLLVRFLRSNCNSQVLNYCCIT